MAAHEESLDFIEIKLDKPDDIDLPPDFTQTQTNYDSHDTQINQNFDLPPKEIDFPHNESDSDNESSNSDPTPNLDDYEMEIEPDTDNDQLPSYKITNFLMTNLKHDDPALLLIDERDETIGWDYEKIDSRPTYGPFLETCRTPTDDPDGKPEVFFSELFDECMWSTIAQSTNTYVQSKTITPTGNRCTDPTNPNYKKTLSFEYMD